MANNRRIAVFVAILLICSVLTVGAFGTSAAGSSTTQTNSTPTGELVWSTETIEEPGDALTIAEGNIYLFTGDGTGSQPLNRFDIDTGTYESGEYATAPTGSQHFPNYATSGIENSILYNTDTTIDKVLANSFGYSSVETLYNSDDNVFAPQYENGNIYFATSGGFFYKTNAAGSQTGLASPTFDSGGSTSTKLTATPVIKNDTVYITLSNNVYAYNKGDMSQKWVAQTSESVTTAPTIANGNVYVGSESSGLLRIDDETGTVSSDTNPSGVNNVYHTPTVVNENIFFTSENSLHSVNTEDNTQNWEKDISVSSSSSGAGTITYSGDTVYVNTNQGVSAYNSGTGTEKWGYAFSGPTTTSLAVANGTLYTGTGDSRSNTNVYAIATDHTESSRGSRVRQSVENDLGPSYDTSAPEPEEPITTTTTPTPTTTEPTTTTTTTTTTTVTTPTTDEPTTTTTTPDNGTGGLEGGPSCLGNLSNKQSVVWIPCYIGTSILGTTFQWLVTGILLAYPIASRVGSDIGTMVIIDGVLVIGMLVGPVSPAYVGIAVITTGLLASIDNSGTDVEITNEGI